jgi:hypothetical protein
MMSSSLESLRLNKLEHTGPWFLYDHNAWHLAAGFSAMLSVISRRSSVSRADRRIISIEDTPVNIKASEQPSAQFDALCSAWNSFNAGGAHLHS